MKKKELYLHIKAEFEMIENEQLNDVARNALLCNLMTRLERNFSSMPIMSPMKISEVQEYFSNHPDDFKVKQLYDDISSARYNK